MNNGESRKSCRDSFLRYCFGRVYSCNGDKDRSHSHQRQRPRLRLPSDGAGDRHGHRACQQRDSERVLPHRTGDALVRARMRRGRCAG